MQKIIKIIFIFYLLFVSSAVSFAATDLPESVLEKENKLLEDPTVSLPTGDIIKDIVPAVIKILLGIAGSVALMSLTFGAVLLITGQGEEEKITKGKSIIVYAVLGLVLISVSYAIIFGIVSVEFE